MSSSTWNRITNSPQFQSFSSDQQDAVRRDFFTTKNPTKEDLQSELYRQANLQGVDPQLAHSVASIESNWDPQAKSPKNASGIMQIMPDTAEKLSKRIGKSKEEILSNPSFNIEAGVSLLKYLGDKYDNDPIKIAQAYNWGEGNLDKKGPLAAPQETKDYVSKLEKQLGRVPTTADVPYKMGKAGKRIVQPVQGEADLESIRNISPNQFKTPQEPTIPDTYKNTSGIEMNEVPYIRGENEDNSYDIVLKPTLSEVKTPRDIKMETPGPWEIPNPIPSPVDLAMQASEKGREYLGKGIKLLGGMNPVSAIPASLAGQFIENPKQLPSLTEAVASELISFIPGGHGLIKGGLTGLAQNIISSLVQTGHLPDLEEAIQSGLLGAFLGKFLPTIQQPEKPFFKTNPGSGLVPPGENIGNPRNVNIPSPQLKQITNQREKLIDDTRPIGQSLTDYERKYVAPIQGKQATEFPPKNNPPIERPYFPSRETLKKEKTVRDNEALKIQAQKLKDLGSTQNDFGQIKEVQKVDEPPIPTAKEPVIPTVLKQLREKQEAGGPSPIPKFPPQENSSPQIKERQSRLDEILGQYEANLRKSPERPSTILPPGPPSHLKTIQSKIEEMRNPKPFSMKQAVEDVHSAFIPHQEEPFIPSTIKKSSRDIIKEEIEKMRSLPPSIPPANKKLSEMSREELIKWVQGDTKKSLQNMNDVERKVRRLKMGRANVILINRGETPI